MKRLLPLALLLAAWPARAADAPQVLEPVTISIDVAKVESTSRFQLGVTHTQRSLDTIGDAHSPAIARARYLLSRAVTYHNVHIMGWGTDNPNPAPGVYNWASLDRRMAMVRSIPNAVPVITLCAAPDWMKGGEPGQTNWKDIEAAPLPQHHADFARLAATIAKRYPDAKYFQVWNEFKGLWSAKLNNWDAARYTDLYNRCYDALKAVGTDIKVGGPYLVVEGTGGGKGPASDATAPPISPRNRRVLEFWLANKKGADFIVLDRSVQSFHDKNSYTTAEAMALTRHFESIAKQVRAMTDLPIWWAEYYGARPLDAPEVVTAAHASILAHMIRGGTSAALLWQPMHSGEIPAALVTDARRPDGGRALPYLDVALALREYFGPGTPLLKADSSSGTVQVLASPDRALLINQGAAPVLAKVNGVAHALGAYDVRLILTPRP